MMKRLRPVLPAVLIAGVICGVLYGFGLVINITPSLPLGIYRKQSVPIRRGCVVMLKLADPQGRPYARGPLIKKVAALPGDQISISPLGVFVNGIRLENSTPMAEDRDGRPLPQLHFDN